MTKKSGVMVMGGNTYRTFKEPLPGRRHIVYTKGSVDGDAYEKATLPPKDLVKQLGDEGYEEVAIIGGGTMYSMFLAAGVVTDVYLTIEPLFFGAGVKFLSEKTDATLKLHSSERLNENTILMHYKV
jgi:dihydrofolate reductase